jgi:hypothetical protein
MDSVAVPGLSLPLLAVLCCAVLWWFAVHGVVEDVW